MKQNKRREEFKNINRAKHTIGKKAKRLIYKHKYTQKPTQNKKNASIS